MTDHNEESTMDVVFMTAKQVAKDFFRGECSYQKVLRLTRKGYLPAVKLGKSYLFKRSELERWATENFSKPAWRKIKV